MAKILVIDDDPELLRMVQLSLERRGGHETILSADGEEALTIAREDPPDLAIVDVMMPGMTGYEVCRQLRERPETASIPIIVLTARGQAVDREAALQAGADVHMAKPVTMSTLLERANSMLEERVASRRPEIMVLLSLRGGVGVTTLAVNVAATLVREARGQVCLVDLCPSSGHAALQLGLRPRPNWRDLMGEEALNEEGIATSLLAHESGLRLLASPVVPLVKEELSRPTVKAVLGALEQRFDILVVDTPSALGEATMAALDAATEACLVAATEQCSIQSTLGTIRALRERSSQIRVILNRTAREGQVSPASVERVLRRSATGVIPFDPGQARALAEGQPLALSRPGSPLATAVGQLAEELV